MNQPNVVAAEKQSAHCKVYAEPSLKAAVASFGNKHGMTFSEAGRELWKIALGM